MQTINSLKYFECAIIGTTQVFTYQSNIKLNIFDIVLVTLRNKEVKAIILQEVNKPSFKCKEIISIYYTPTSNEIDFIKFISFYYFSTYSETLSIFNLQKNNSLSPIKIETKIKLNEIQLKAFNFCQNNKISILFGDTGSGKTEIYIKLIENIINQNKTAIFLLPEIAITSQMEKRLKQHFSDLVEIWHSKITKPKKQKILENIKTGKTRIIAGARSALFINMPDLGIIIVDEFHDDSYKSQNIPLYNAKDLAIYKSKYDIKVVLGSATPLISDIYKHSYFRLKGNFYNSKNQISFISRFEESFNKIKETLDKNGQIIVFIPTRANFKYMICADCGEAVKCPFCDVGMSIHSKNRVLKCHYCNYGMKIPNQCPKCQSESFINERIGSSEVVEILNTIFPTKMIQKFDRDIITSKTRLDKILKDFNNKKIDILVGTQMLSKGHDYDVDLAIILDIDFVLNMPDFRARERALSLAIQVAGRAGRRKNAEVIIQTRQEDFFKQTYDEFINEELEFRKELNYPPFTRLLKLEFSDKKQIDAYNEMIKVKNCLNEVEILGFGEAPISKIASKYRYQILLKGKNLHKIIWKCKTPKTRVDIDPVSFS